MVRNVGKNTVALTPYFLCIVFWYPILAQNAVDIKITAKGEIGIESTLNCTVSPENATIMWLFDGELLKPDIRRTISIKTIVGNKQEKDPDGTILKLNISTLKIKNTTLEDAGNYTCFAKYPDKEHSKVKSFEPSFKGKLVNVTEGPIQVNRSSHSNVTLTCVFEVYKPGKVKWYKLDTSPEDVPSSLEYPTQKNISTRQTESSVMVHISNSDLENGTYVCQIEDQANSVNLTGSVEILVYAEPSIEIDNIVAINTSQVFLNWTLKANNHPIYTYELFYRENKPELSWNGYSEDKIKANETSFIINSLKNYTEYEISLRVSNGYGKAKSEKNVTTLSEEPIFVPNISINGFSATSVTIGWLPPPANIANLIHYYYLEARKKDENVTRKAYHSRDSRNLPYMFDNLEPHSTYIFQVCACSEYTGKCGKWSQEMEAATLDGTPGRPSDVTIVCYETYINMTWGAPEKPNAEIKGYTMELTGHAMYRDRNGELKATTWGPLTKFMTNDSRSVRFNDLQPNTNYTIRLSAMTRTRRRGDEETKYCTTARAAPDHPPRPRWRKIYEDDKYLFKMFLPRISERNGPICCYRVYMVRLPSEMSLYKLEPPDAMEFVDYKQAHVRLGAYLVDILSNDRYPSSSEIILGDNNVYFNEQDRRDLDTEDCRRCVRRPKKLSDEATRVFTIAPDYKTDDPELAETTTVAEPVRRRRHDDSHDLKILANYGDGEFIEPTDGPLVSEANYTLFVELILGAYDNKSVFSAYANALRPAASPSAATHTNPLEIILQVACVVAALVLLGTIIFCVMQTRKSRKPPHAHLEMNPIQYAFRYVVGLRGRQNPIPSPPPDMPPIAKEDLAAAYSERQANSDYNFQKEFELLQTVPECYSDRTTHASEARENHQKNRYPDIKAYDQTRVKLSLIEGVPGSDYINANFVMGYQERKRFICAQGPTDTTVNDFWRMIWEHDLELVVMLTNLEEYSKVKCSKYWPDEVKGNKAFGNITVHYVGEKRYSDYIVRELQISKQPTNADGQPVVENNGIAKRNGECKDASELSAPTSPREHKDSADTRTVRQYHFVMWKDFAAPEHSHSILKFIKRVNEAWCSMVSRPVVVHCSAGVGRTGTLVALDCLIDRLRETGHAPVFNTIVELRRQRNFLVQSLKQYVFVYRAMVEYAHYGDTEIPASKLKSAIDGLRNMPEGADKCLMEHEFEKMLNSPVCEPVKSCTAGAAEEVRSRNRSPDCVPYDRNRVILTPLPLRDYSTYINASFIEAYDNSEGFIITQDPLPNTIMDFWRMVSEHNVTTIVMLSELGEGKCPRYWDDVTAQYENISVQYEESESCPYYTRRQFRVVNNKSGEVSSVRQLQYQGWPTAPGHVPEVTRGLAELADAADPLRAQAPHVPHPPNSTLAQRGTMLVHCQYGTERSALFVALCILICQLRIERRVDVSCVARKVRSQRANTIDTFLQYEFLHRAILNYAELHNLHEDS